jgi:hypothetical protein
MPVKPPKPSSVERYVDKEGRLTLDGQRLFDQLLRVLADHEARIKVLEP